MPLCTLELDIAQYSALPEESRDKIAKSLADEILHITHDTLEVPDPNDRETRIVLGTKPPRVTVSCTYRGIDYPVQNPGVVYDLTPDQIHAAAVAIQELARKSPFGISETIIEPWANTFFIMREEGKIEPVPEPQARIGEEIRKNIRELKLTLVIPQDRLGGVSSSKEISPLKDLEPYQIVIDGVAKFVFETLGLPEEEAKGMTRVFPVHFADTDWAVEIDFKTESGYVIPKPVLEYIGRGALNLLDTNKLTDVGIAEVWVRQGKPDSCSVASNNN